MTMTMMTICFEIDENLEKDDNDDDNNKIFEKYGDQNLELGQIVLHHY